MPEEQEQVAYTDVLGDDQGGGFTWCSNCHKVLNSSASEYMREKEIPTHCPGCGYKLLSGKITPYPFGGSDF